MTRQRARLGEFEREVLKIAGEAGADDVLSNEDGSVDVLTEPDQFVDIKEAMIAAGQEPEQPRPPSGKLPCRFLRSQEVQGKCDEDHTDDDQPDGDLIGDHLRR